MNKVISTMVAVCAAFTVSAADWHAKVSDCAQDPAQLRQTIGTLSAADQTAFLAEVNEAIAKMPGSDEVKAAKFLDANRAAVIGATKENRSSVLAEVYATVPPEYLTVINEEFAKNPFNRSVDPSKPVSNEKFLDISTNVMSKISKRCESVTDGSGAARAAFAALMFERASNGQEGIRDALVAQLPASSQETAKSEWLPAAMGEGREKTYDPMLGVSAAGEEPDHAAALNLASSPMATPEQAGVVLLSEVQGADEGSSAGVGSVAAPGIVGAARLDPAGVGLERINRAATFGKTPVNLKPVIGLDGKVATDADGNPLFVGPGGEILKRTKDGKGNDVFVDSDGNEVANPYYRGKRGDDAPTPTPTPTPEPSPY